MTDAFNLLDDEELVLDGRGSGIRLQLTSHRITVARGGKFGDPSSTQSINLAAITSIESFRKRRNGFLFGSLVSLVCFIFFSSGLGFKGQEETIVTSIGVVSLVISLVLLAFWWNAKYTWVRIGSASSEVKFPTTGLRESEIQDFLLSVEKTSARARTGTRS